MDLALNNLQRLMCHKTQPNQPKLTPKEDAQYIYILVNQGTLSSPLYNKFCNRKLILTQLEEGFSWNKIFPAKAPSLTA